jgi:hypothetical protein
MIMATERTKRTLLGLLALIAAGALGASPFPGGCGSPVQESHEYTETVDQSCDTTVNGKPPPGCEGGGGFDPGDPPRSPNCPDDYPLDCGGSCCPEDYPWCCADKAWCGTDYEACQQVDNPTGAGSTGSGSSGPGGGGLYCSSVQTCPGGGGTLEFCADTGLDNCYYLVNGEQFPCASCSSVEGCATQAANYLYQLCQ